MGNIQRHIFICFISFLLLHIQIVSSQADEVPIYFLTFNDSTQQSEIWEYPIGADEAKRILVLERNTLQIQESFSTNELTYLRDYVEENNYLEQGWAEANPPKRYANGIWRFDNTHLLVRMVNEVQDAYARMGSAIRGLFGYYEFLLVDLGDVPNVTSFIKIDYHDQANKDWGSFNLTDVVSVEPLLNPHQSNVVFSIMSRTDFRCWLTCSSVLVMDYSESSSKMTRVPLASKPVWSPDGQHLIYLQAQCNTEFNGCGINLEVMPMNNGSRQIVPGWKYDDYRGWMETGSLFTFEWLDNINVFYRIFPPRYEGDYVIFSFKTYNLDTETTADFPSERMDDYSVIAEKVNDTYVFNPAASFDSYLTPVILENGGRKFVGGFYPIYNPRFPDRMIFRDNNSSQIVLYESGNNQTVIDLSSIMPHREWVAAIAP